MTSVFFFGAPKNPKEGAARLAAPEPPQRCFPGRMWRAPRESPGGSTCSAPVATVVAPVLLPRLLAIGGRVSRSSRQIRTDFPVALAGKPRPRTVNKAVYLSSFTQPFMTPSNLGPACPWGPKCGAIGVSNRYSRLAISLCVGGFGPVPPPPARRRSRMALPQGFPVTVLR